MPIAADTSAETVWSFGLTPSSRGVCDSHSSRQTP
jgi:hypothetical protein